MNGLYLQCEGWMEEQRKLKSWVEMNVRFIGAQSY